MLQQVVFVTVFRLYKVNHILLIIFQICKYNNLQYESLCGKGTFCFSTWLWKTQHLKSVCWVMCVRWRCVVALLQMDTQLS